MKEYRIVEIISEMYYPTKENNHLAGIKIEPFNQKVLRLIQENEKEGFEFVTVLDRNLIFRKEINQCVIYLS